MNSNEGHIDFDLLAKYLANETTTAENTQVEEWLKVNPSNQTILDKLKGVMGLTELVNKPVTVDTNAAWNKMQQKIQANKGAKIVEFSNAKAERSRLKWMGIAAVLVGFMLMAGWLFNNLQFNNGNDLLVAMAIDEIVMDSLPDGSLVTINKNSSLEYYEQFIDNERRVELVGEAFFEVVKDSSKPFIIDAGELEVIVLGTSFNVKANYEDDVTEVVVETGKVKVIDKNQNQVILLPGEKGIYNKQTEQLQKLVNDDVDFQFWRLKKLVFSNTTLNEVIDVLNKQYEANLYLEDNTSAACRFTATFNDDSLETILNVLTATFNLELVITDNKRVLKGKACNGISL